MTGRIADKPAVRRTILGRDTNVRLSLCLVQRLSFALSFSRPALSSTHSSLKPQVAHRYLGTRTALKLLPTKRDVVADPVGTQLSADLEDDATAALGAGVSVAHTGECPISVAVVDGGIGIPVSYRQDGSDRSSRSPIGDRTPPFGDRVSGRWGFRSSEIALPPTGSSSRCAGVGLGRQSRSAAASRWLEPLRASSAQSVGLNGAKASTPVSSAEYAQRRVAASGSIACAFTPEMRASGLSSTVGSAMSQSSQ